MPADYINKLARMFQDIKVSNDLNQGFKKEYKNKGDIAGTVLALNRGHCTVLQCDVLQLFHERALDMRW